MCRFCKVSEKFSMYALSLTQLQIVSCRAHVSLAYCRCLWKKKEVKENPSCTIPLTSLARPISFSRRACNSFRQFFCQRTRENSGSRNYRDAADPTRPGNRAKINANPSNLSSAMTKGRRRHTINHGNREKKRQSQWTAFEGKRNRQFFSLVSVFSLSISPDLIFALQHSLLFFVHLELAIIVTFLPPRKNLHDCTKLWRISSKFHLT